MSTDTLNLSESLLAMGRELHEQGRARDARLLFARLVKFRDLPAAIAEEAHSRLSDLLIADKQYKKARRHLAILMCLKPSAARYYHQYAYALHRDPKGDPHRAVKYYQQALDIDPTKARCWSNYGKLLISMGRMPESVAALRQAYTLRDNDPVIIGRLAEALCLDDRQDEARSLLRTARFRNPRDGRFRKLWNDFQFRVAAGTYETNEDDPVLLPFIRRALIGQNGGPGSIIRLDDARPTVTPPHRIGRSLRRDA